MFKNKKKCYVFKGKLTLAVFMLKVERENVLRKIKSFNTFYTIFSYFF